MNFYPDVGHYQGGVSNAVNQNSADFQFDENETEIINLIMQFPTDAIFTGKCILS